MGTVTIRTEVNGVVVEETTYEIPEVPSKEVVNEDKTPDQHQDTPVVKKANRTKK